MDEHTVEEYIAQAEMELENSSTKVASYDYKMLCALQSIACSTVAICKLLKSGDSP